MKGLAKFAAICALLVAGGYAAFSMIFPTYYIRYRLTLDIDVNGVTRSGTGVVDISYQIMPEALVSGFEGSHFAGIMRGYAITVDLREKGLLFLVNAWPMLANAKDGKDLFPHAGALGSLPLIAFGFPPEGKPSRMEGILRDLKSETGSIDVTFDKLPMLVHFRDILDKNSMEEINPNDLAAVLGRGIRLKRVTLTLTDEPVTSRPKNWPRWLAEDKFQNLQPLGDLYSSVGLSYKIFAGD